MTHVACHTIDWHVCRTTQPLGSRGPLRSSALHARPFAGAPHKPFPCICSSAIRTTKPRLTYAGVPGSEDGMSGAKAAWQALDNLSAPSISKPDAYFADKNLEFVHGGQDIDLEELNDVRTHHVAHDVHIFRFSSCLNVLASPSATLTRWQPP